MLHLNSEPYIPGTKGPDQTSDVILTFTSSLAYMYLIHFRRLNFMSTSMFFLHNKLYHYNWKAATLSLHPPGLGIPEQIFTSSIYETFHSWKMFSWTILDHSYVRLRTFVSSMKNRMQEVYHWNIKQCYILNFGELKAEAETRDQIQARALPLNNISTPQSKLRKQSGPSLCAQTMLAWSSWLQKMNYGWIVWIFYSDP